MSKKGHRRRQQETKVHRNKYAKFSHAEENLREQEARGERLRRQAEEAERKRQREIRESVPWWQRDSLGSGGGIRYYQSFSQYLLEDNILHLPHERYQARSLIEII